MSIIQCNYLRLIKFCIITVTAFSLFACDDVLKVLTAIKSQESEAREKYEEKKQDKEWLASHLLAGNMNKKGHKDGQGSNALFSDPLGMTRDSHGNIYIADSGNHVIRKVTPKGKVTTWAGTPGTKGFHDGTLKDALFNNPTNLIMINGIMYVLDTDNHKIRKIVDDTVSTAVGGAKGYKDNPAGTKGVQFEYPQGGFSAFNWSDKSMMSHDPHKKYGDHTDISIYDGQNAKRWRGIVLKDGEIKSIETVQEEVRFNGLEKNVIVMILDNAFVILDPTKNALFKFPLGKKN